MSPLFAAIISSCLCAPARFDEAGWKKDVESQRVEKLYEPHHKLGKYVNPWMPMEPHGFSSLFKWWFSGKARYTDEEEAFLPHVLRDLEDRIKAVPDSDFIAWIGHATFLIRVQGQYWLTDPMFSKRALIPKRVTPPALTGEGLRRLTDQVNVIVSHNHYDHLDKASIRALPEKSRIFVPLGLKHHTASLHPGEIREMDWWQEINLEDDVKLACLPAQHWSRRMGQPFNSTLWASFMLITPKTVIYFGADSGYFVGYREIGRRYPDINYAIIPTTAYHPRWFMHYAHMDTNEALKAFEDMGADYFIPCQWGTFRLGDDPPGYPALDLKRAIHNPHLDPSRYIIMDIGGIINIPEKTDKGP